jgi:hypothetical protein
MNNWYICWFSTNILTGILIFKGLTARRLYTSFGVKGLNALIRLLMVNNSMRVEKRRKEQLDKTDNVGVTIVVVVQE